MNSKRTTTIGTVIAVVIVAAGGYLLFIKKDSGVVVITDTPVTNSAEATFLSLTSQLEPVGFDTSILNDPRFMSLVDIHTAILPEASGRKDPFAPLGR